jgi:hypothetical protein
MVSCVMVRAVLATITRAPRLTRILASVALALFVVFVFDRMLLRADSALARPVIVEFCGFTNLSSGKCAIFAIQNQSQKVLKLTDLIYMEYYHRPILDSGNTSRRYVTGTNFVFYAGQGKRLSLPVSEVGGSWNVYFEFTQEGWRAELGAYLQRAHANWLEFLPKVLSGARPIKVVFYLSSQALATRP